MTTLFAILITGIVIFALPKEKPTFKNTLASFALGIMTFLVVNVVANFIFA